MILFGKTLPWMGLIIIPLFILAEQLPGMPQTDLMVIEDYLSQPDSEIDIGYANLLMGKVLNPLIDINFFDGELNAIVNIVKKQIRRDKKPQKIIEKINAIIFDQYNFEALAEPYPEDFLLDNLIQSKKGRCMSLVALYSTLGYRLNLPIEGVCVPEHIFARWVPEEKKKRFSFKKNKHINIETTLDGIELSDKYYLNMLNNLKAEAENPFFLRPLSKKEVIGAYLSSLGSALRVKDRFDKSIAVCKLAISINENDAEAWNNLGISYRKKGLNELAVASYNKAIKIYPNFAEAWQNLGSVQASNMERIRCFKKAVTIKPSLSTAWKNLVIAYYEIQNYELAWTCANRCREQGHFIPQELLRKIQFKLRSER